MKSADDLVKIAAAGGSLRFSASARSTKDLVRIAEVAAANGGTVHLTEADMKSTVELVQIAAAAKGVVSFELD